MPSRNQLCPCGSGLKYKKCCLKKDEAERKVAPYKSEKTDMKFEEVPREQVTEKQAKEVVERMRRAIYGKPKESLWRKIKSKIKP